MKVDLYFVKFCKILASTQYITWTMILSHRRVSTPKNLLSFTRSSPITRKPCQDPSLKSPSLRLSDWLLSLACAFASPVAFWPRLTEVWLVSSTAHKIEGNSVTVWPTFGTKGLSRHEIQKKKNRKSSRREASFLWAISPHCAFHPRLFEVWWVVSFCFCITIHGTWIRVSPSLAYWRAAWLLPDRGDHAKASANLSVQVSVWTYIHFKSVESIPMNTLAGSYGKNKSCFVKS